MPIRVRHAPRALALLVSAAAALGFGLAVHAQEAAAFQPRVYAPLAFAPAVAALVSPPAVQSSDWLSRVNYYRALAGVPPVGEDPALSANCLQHARYMAENNHLTHSQDPSRPFASPEGQACAQKGDVWLGHGSGFSTAESVDGWMTSVGHRLWLLYPTTSAFGYGFYAGSGHEAAALDVLSRLDVGADAAYTGWPVRYPGANQIGVPPGRTAVTLLWRHFGATPAIGSTELRTADGSQIAHTADTGLPGGHKGVQIVPQADLPANTVFVVQVTGMYEGAPFSVSWQFSTGDLPFATTSGGPAETTAEPPAHAPADGVPAP